MMMLKVNIVMLVLISVSKVMMRKIKGLDPCIEQTFQDGLRRRHRQLYASRWTNCLFRE